MTTQELFEYILFTYLSNRNFGCRGRELRDQVEGNWVQSLGQDSRAVVLHSRLNVSLYIDVTEDTVAIITAHGI